MERTPGDTALCPVNLVSPSPAPSPVKIQAEKQLPISRSPGGGAVECGSASPGGRMKRARPADDACGAEAEAGSPAEEISQHGSRIPGYLGELLLICASAKSVLPTTHFSRRCIFFARSDVQLLASDCNQESLCMNPGE